MIAVLFAALAASAYGASDFTGAIATRRHAAVLVTFAVQVVSLLALAGFLLAFPEDHRTLQDLAWGAIGGVCAGAGLALLYHGLARGPMSTVASLTGLVSAGLPVIAGLLLGDRPSSLALAGIALAIPSVVLVSSTPDGLGRFRVGPRDRVVDTRHIRTTRVVAVLAGVGFGLFFVALSRVSADAGLFPLVGARAGSLTMLSVVLTLRSGWQCVGRASWPLLALGGVLDFAANAFYLEALSRGTFTWVAAISSLYPVSTALLARWLLAEPLTRRQSLGLGLAGGALALVAIGR